MRRIAIGGVAVVALVWPATALGGQARDFRRDAFVPPDGRVFHGVSETVEGVHGVRVFSDQVGAHPAVVQDFFPWDTPLSTGALRRWANERARGMLSLSTRSSDNPEIITPRQIAVGRDDRYIVRVNQSIAASKQVVYIRLMGEMNGYWNPYCAFNPDGSRREGHSTAWFRRAWRRFVIIVRGGSIKAINAKLAAQGLPLLFRAGGNRARVYAAKHIGDGLDHPRVAMVWNPQTIANPYIYDNRPAAYWPGRRYVDWVGADIYSKFATPGVRAALRDFERGYKGLPMAIGEYAPWDNDFQGEFTSWLFRWARHHPRVRMLVYYRSTVSHNPFDISGYPVARRKLRRILNSHHYMQFAPGV